MQVIEILVVWFTVLVELTRCGLTLIGGQKEMTASSWRYHESHPVCQPFGVTKTKSPVSE